MGAFFGEKIERGCQAIGVYQHTTRIDEANTTNRIKMNSIANRFAALAVDNSSEESSKTPRYAPTPLTRDEVAYVRKLDAEMKGTDRFRGWTREGDNENSGNTQSIFGGNRRQRMAAAAPTVRQEDIAASEGKYRPPAIREAITQAKKKAPIDSSSVEQFPSLGGSGSGAPKRAWTASGAQSFAKKVADLAEREQNEEMRRRLEEEENERRRVRETVVISFSSRFRRPLEDVLADDDDDLDQGFDDDHYDPSTRYEEAAGPYDDNEEDN